MNLSGIVEYSCPDIKVCDNMALVFVLVSERHGQVVVQMD